MPRQARWGSTMWGTGTAGRSSGFDDGDCEGSGRASSPAGATIDGLTRELAGFVEAGFEHGECFVVVDVERPEPCSNRFVQIAFDGTDVYAEASAMVCLPWECDGRHALTEAQQARLRALGWLPPAGDPDAGRPNWHRSFASMRNDLVPLVADLLARTLIEVMEVRDLQELALTVDQFQQIDEPDPSCTWSPRFGHRFCSTR